MIRFILAFFVCLPVWATDLFYVGGMSEKYLFYGKNLYDEPVAQNKLILSSTNGLYLGGIATKGWDFEELNAYVGYDRTVKKFDCEVGLGLRDDEAWLAYTEISRRLKRTSMRRPPELAVRFEHYSSLPSSDVDGGNYLSFIARHYYRQGNTALNLEEWVTYDSGGFNQDSGWLVRLSGALGFNVYKSLYLGPKLSLDVPLTDDDRMVEVIGAFVLTMRL